jgi:D-3-phosphoglycerate dehydrogenase / 2-oxoglutarate reductase
MARPKVLIALYHLGERARPLIERLERGGCEVTTNTLGRCYTEEELARILPGTFGTIAAVEPYTDRVFEAAKDLKVVARYGVGYDAVDLAAATRHGVAIAMAFGANHEAVADSAFTLLAAVVQQTVPTHLLVKGGGWKSGKIHPGLWKLTVGIVGLGRIGKAMARRCRGFDMRVLAYEVKPDLAFAREHGVELVPLETVFREADVVTVHAPHSAETDKLVNRERLALMRPGSYLVNTARGGLVDEDALYEALTTGQLAGAGLDVFRNEPLPKDSPLLTLDNVVLSPHSAGLNLRSEEAVGRRCVESILAVARGESPGAEYVLNPEVFQTDRPAPGA